MNETHICFIRPNNPDTGIRANSAVSINTKLFAAGANKQAVIDMEISFCYILQ